MKYSIALGLTLGSALLLAGCGEKAPGNDTGATTPAATNAAGPMANMAEMDMSVPEAKTAKGTGTVTAIDKAAGPVTLDHGPIAEAGWPAMTMAFKAKPQSLESVSVGDKVAFELALKDGAGEVVAIARQ